MKESIAMLNTHTEFKELSPKELQEIHGGESYFVSGWFDWIGHRTKGKTC